ncbi:MAG: hypothetical protein JSV78_01015 [Phycisphaerales bacterium]|nr:MAG: hypothetical protein JSV78_01015 [Phycisphaerales bacterium]
MVDRCDHPDKSSPREKLPKLLVVEPERLLQWCLVEYLAQWFDVLAVDCGCEAERSLNARRLDAVVVSDALPADEVRSIEQQALKCNPEVQLVRTVTDPLKSSAVSNGVAYVEKPFKLADLAHLLGILGAR